MHHYKNLKLAKDDERKITCITVFEQNAQNDKIRYSQDIFKASCWRFYTYVVGSIEA